MMGLFQQTHNPGDSIFVYFGVLRRAYRPNSFIARLTRVVESGLTDHVRDSNFEH